ncbi:MAG: PrsW family intramembrane metalloprotease [Anaerolineales bacterium]|nr:PrsW family intramembrane metalloprotease [Anaerolineales bacterium]
MGLLVSLFFAFGGALLFAFILYSLDRYEKEPLLLLGGVFLWGVVIAAGSAFIINTLLSMSIYIFTGSATAAEITSASIVAPLVEESLKGLAVLGVFLAFRREFDSVLDGIIYAGIAALGFAATENAYYIFSYGYQDGGWGGLWLMVFIRIILVGWQHPFYTAFFGIGLAIARLNRNWGIKIIAPLIGLSLAMFTHAFHNGMASLLPDGLGGLAAIALLDWTGWLFMIIVIIWATVHEKKYLRKHLWEEVNSGVISRQHYDTVASVWKQMSARINALFSGRLRATARFFQVCGELAHKKQQFIKLGDESGNAAIIQGLRAELTSLVPQIKA